MTSGPPDHRRATAAALQAVKAHAQQGGDGFVGHHQHLDHHLRTLHGILTTPPDQDAPETVWTHWRDGILAGLSRLWEEAATHFAHEEKLMEDTDYGPILAHRQAHQVFLTLIEMEMHSLGSHPGHFLPGPLCRSLGSWLTTHSRSHDSDLALFLCRGGG